NLDRHLKNHMGGGMYQCSLCNFTAHIKQSLTVHIQNHHLIYRCPQCSFWATTASRFHVHMVGHTNTKPFECSQCAYRSNWRHKDKRMVLAHMAKHTRRDNFSCGLCGKGSNWQSSQYVYHRQFHRPRGAPYKCSQCSYNVSRRHLLNQHLSVHDGGGKKLHFCAHCPARFLVETELLIHQRFHGVKLAFRCDVCSYTARQENHLLAHWKVHRIGGETQSNCHHCRKDLGQLPAVKALQYHISLHGGNGPFRCRFCNYAVKAQDNLTKHEKLHLHQTEDEDEMTAETTTDNNTKPLKRFQCSKCPSSFEKKEQFKVHSNLHGSKQRYRCDRCDYAVKYYTNFLQHMKRH
ncbi:hypothetical protein DAPPUDRAFT_30674, partial [Daphnia pulex]